MTMRPDEAYVICTLPRSGSYLLAEALASSERAGYPAEYLNSNHDRFFSRMLGERKFADYNIVFDTMLRMGTTPNGIFSIKVLWFHLDEMRDRFQGIGQYHGMDGIDILRMLLPPARYVRLLRRNKVRQAISYVRACDSQVWYTTTSTSTSTTGATVDHSRIMVWKQKLEAWEEDWDRALTRIGAEVRRFDHEALVQDLEGATRAVHEFIGETLPPRFRLPPPTLRQQSDEMSYRWEMEFREWEASGRALLDV